MERLREEAYLDKEFFLAIQLSQRSKRKASEMKAFKYIVYRI